MGAISLDPVVAQLVAVGVKVIRRNIAKTVIGVAAVAAVRIIGIAAARAVDIEGVVA